MDEFIRDRDYWLRYLSQRVKQVGDCLIWTLHRNKDGYGEVQR